MIIGISVIYLKDYVGCKLVVSQMRNGPFRVGFFKSDFTVTCNKIFVEMSLWKKISTRHFGCQCGQRDLNITNAVVYTNVMPICLFFAD